MTQPPIPGGKDRLADVVTDRVTSALGDFLPAGAPQRITRTVGDLADHLPTAVSDRIAEALTPRDPASRRDQVVPHEAASPAERRPAAGELGPAPARPAPAGPAPRGPAPARPAADRRVPSRPIRGTGHEAEPPESLADRAKATGQAVLITLGVVLPLGWLVLPWTSSRLIDAWRRGRRGAARFVWGATAAAVQVALSIPVFLDGLADDGTIVGVGPSARAATGPALWWSLAAISASVLLITGVRLGWARLRTRRVRTRHVARPKVDRSLFDSTDAGRRVEDALGRLSQYAPLYSGLVVGDRRVSDQLTHIIELTHELFRRLGARSTEHRTRLAEVEYADILGKVALLACPDYLQDVVAHPELWHHPEQRVTEATTAFDAVARQLLENIRQANAATDLDFQVALASLNAITQDDEFAALYAGGR